MEKWARSLSQTTALVIGVVALIITLAAAVVVNYTVSGFLPLILMCAVLGAGIGFAVPLLVKGFTGQTPQEKKEAQKR